MLQHCLALSHGYSNFTVGTTKAQVRDQLELTSEEQVLYTRLAENGILLEQERIPFIFSKQKLVQAVSA